MFDLDVSDDRVAVSSLARSIGLDVLSPAAKTAEKARSVPAAVGRSLHDTGLTTVIDEAYGGSGMPDVVTHLAAVEAFSYGDPGLTMAACWAGSAAILIGLCGTEEQKKRWLPPLAADPTARSAVALYEGFGRAPSEFGTTITRGSGTDAWTVTGRKLAVPYADVATPVVVVGVDPNSGNLRAVIVEVGHPGISISADDEHIALAAAPRFTVTLNATVSEEQLLGGQACDTAELERAVGWVRLLVAAAQCGVGQRATDYASKYASERIAFGKPIATFQGVSFLLADSALRIGAARLELFDAAAHLDARLAGSESIVNHAVNYASAVGTATTRDAIQVLGGHGFITDHPVELWYRSAAALSVLDHDPLLSNFEPAL